MDFLSSSWSRNNFQLARPFMSLDRVTFVLILNALGMQDYIGVTTPDAAKHLEDTIVEKGYLMFLESLPIPLLHRVCSDLSLSGYRKVNNRKLLSRAIATLSDVDKTSLPPSPQKRKLVDYDFNSPFDSKRGRRTLPSSFGPPYLPAEEDEDEDEEEPYINVRTLDGFV